MEIEHERLDFKSIEKRWRAAWEDSKAFEAKADTNRKKFFVTFPYPYMNGYLHLGHFYTIMRTEVFARYKRLTGHNVLFPQGWHCTGSPIESVAKRIREKEPKQLQTMKLSGFSDDQIGQFADPKFWTEFFPKAAKKDLIDLGLSIDFRREFITTDLNPHYNKFIEWQFRKLREGGYVVKGNHPVVWCPKDNCPVGDHDRIEGEGEGPQEYTFMKYQMDDSYLIAATLRPETVFGDTNIWLNPDVEYVKADVDDEAWIISRECADKLRGQDKKVEVKSTIKGRDLIGKTCIAPITRNEIPILPAGFCDPAIGTGIVRSVPSHAPPDWMALKFLQEHKEECAKFGLDFERVKAIQPISVIEVEGFKDHPAIEMCAQMKITHHNQKDLIDKATKEVYKKEFHTGIMKPISGKYKGMKVEAAKNAIRNASISASQGSIFYELTGKVVCRCLTPSVIKVVRDQWFMNYADPKWKNQAHESLAGMRLYPEKSRQQFDYVIDWMNDWACVREFGLGTRLPWDRKWVIEALSDSTIYMAYYTISHLLKTENPEDINDALFDYLFLSIGEAPKSIKNASQMKQEFDYWYPLDFRNSGKDLIQNHLTMCIFNHTAIFPKKHWPQSFGVNGWVTVDGKKMSKSQGNFILLKELIEKQPVDVSRITVLSGGEGLDDPNWDSEFAKSAPSKIQSLYELITENHAKGREGLVSADKWMESKLHTIFRDASSSMEETNFRSALQRIFFDLPKALRQYLRKTEDKPNRKIMQQAIESQIIMLSPFAPFICEEMWSRVGKKGFVIDAAWPMYDPSKIDEKATFIDDLIQDTRKDIDAVIQLAKISAPKKVTLFIAHPWKYQLATIIKDALTRTRNPGDIHKEVMASDLRQHGASIQKILPRLISNPSGLPELVLSQDEEMMAFEEGRILYAQDLRCDIEIVLAQKSDHPKALAAMPGKPAIVVE